MQQTADVEILWILVAAVECLPAYGSFFCFAAAADSDAVVTVVDVAAEMTAVCGSFSFSAAAADGDLAEMAAAVAAAAMVVADAS